MHTNDGAGTVRREQRWLCPSRPCARRPLRRRPTGPWAVLPPAERPRAEDLT
jgi:hypothetical protein